MCSAIDFKDLAKVIDIAIDSGYTIFVRRTPPVSSVMSFFAIPLYRIRVGFRYSVELTLS